MVGKLWCVSGPTSIIRQVRSFIFTATDRDTGGTGSWPRL